MSIFPTTCPNGDCPGWRVTFPAGTAREVCPWSGEPLEVAEHAGLSPWPSPEVRPMVTLPVSVDLTELSAAELAEVLAAMDAAVAEYVASVTA